MRNGVLASFDLPDSVYSDDVLAIKEQTVRRYGIEEWRRVVMTNEIHGHLGIYSTIGAKMGCFVLSRLGDEDEPRILSYAGTKPPVSCFNDGLQVSTGGTLGHGLITVSDEAEKRIEAVFTLGENSLRICLKPEYQNRIREDIRRGVEMYQHTAPYWQYVRSLAIKYWAEWDREEIFQIL